MEKKKKGILERMGDVDLFGGESFFDKGKPKKEEEEEEEEEVEEKIKEKEEDEYAKRGI